MTDQNTISLPHTKDNLTALRSQLLSETEKKQLQLIPKIVSFGDSGLDVLIEFLRSRQSVPANFAVGKAYIALYQAKTPKSEAFLQAEFPSGVVPLQSERNIDYQPLQRLLAELDFQAADRLTLEKLCELAGSEAIKRKWLYFTEVEKIPITDLQTINNLWLVHSEGKFGFSVQREIWLSVGKDFSKVWSKIGWKRGKNWTRYPNEFIWDLGAPKGHLPLSNQLRGVRVITSLLSHPAWSEKT